MSSIDTSNIDESKPQRGNATTESVRANFAEIKRQLESARNDVESLEQGVTDLGANKADAAALADLSGVTDTGVARERLGLGSAATAEASAFATTLLADEDATAARETLAAQRDAVPSLAALQALPPGQRRGAVYLLGRTAPGDGGEGVFQWLEGDYSDKVAADPLHGIFAPSDDDPTGAAGCWVRAHVGEVRVPWLPSPQGAVELAVALELPLVLIGEHESAGELVANGDLRIIVDGEASITLTEPADTALHCSG